MVLETEFLQRIVLVLAISLIIGLDRQRGSKKEMFSGVRTFILAGLFGLMSVYLGQLIGNYVIVLAAFGALSVLTIAGYFVEYNNNKTWHDNNHDTCIQERAAFILEEFDN